MTADRFLGAGFASVHGPTAPRSMMLWSLDQGFQGLIPAPCPRSIDWVAMRRERDRLPFRFGGLRVSGILDAELAEAGLAATDAGDRERALAAVRERVAFAAKLGVARVVLEPGIVGVPGEVAATDLGDRSAGWTEETARALLARRNARLEGALDQACRSLHQLCKEHPDVEFCLTTSRHVLGLGDERGLGFIVEDLARCRLGYWHDTVAAACRARFLGEDPGELLENRSNQLQGMTLGDFSGGEQYLPPGAGGVDYPLLSAYRQRTAKDFSVVVELDPGVDPGELRGVQAFLDKFGL